MDQAIKQKWVEALLSGKYAQTNGYMRDANGYCCLGVLRECMGLGGTDRHILTKIELIAAGLEMVPPLYDDEIQIEGFMQQNLASLNDAGVPFDMIAGLIDEAL